MRLLFRLMLMGVGLGLLTGSLLRWFAPDVRRQTFTLPSWLQSQIGFSTGSKDGGQPTSTAQPKLVDQSFQPTTEIKALSNRWREIAATQKDLVASAYLLILDDGRYAQLDANRPMPAASSIKTPVLLASLERIDAQDLNWNEPLELTEENY